METRTPYPALAEALQALQAKDNLRVLMTIEKREGPFVWSNGRRFLNLSSNDYLGLAADPALQEAFHARHRGQNPAFAPGLSASSSRLLSGSHAAHARLETLLAACYQREAALVFTSGYHANLGLITALVGPRDAVFADRLAHASLLDGILLSGAKLHRYRHLDCDHLEMLLVKHRPGASKALIVTESIFSMDGDAADLPRLAALKKKYGCWLYLDEAHAVGVVGEKGLGLAEKTRTLGEIDFLIGTFGKALAGLGAFLIADRVVVDYVLNHARPFIFTTALPPLLADWQAFLWERLHTWGPRRERLLSLSARLRQSLHALGLPATGQAHIIPVVLGENAPTLHVAQEMQTAGYWLMAIRPPTVMQGTARLRLSLTADMRWEDLSGLPQRVSAALASCRPSALKGAGA
ncbi:8-amino-7-oxononanoate synthase [candidate division FCPU426 bacterium]|nr:8-amino-7-oxononanoate synthase [candidate division FCPU426 bacterium]